MRNMHSKHNCSYIIRATTYSKTSYENLNAINVNWMKFLMEYSHQTGHVVFLCWIPEGNEWQTPGSHVVKGAANAPQVHRIAVLIDVLVVYIRML